MRRARVIPKVAETFGTEHPIPLVIAGYKPRRGWQASVFRNRVSRSSLSKIRESGYTKVRLELADRTAEFSIEELLR